MAEYNTEQFEKDCKALGVTLSDEQIRQFLKYFEMLVERNECSCNTENGKKMTLCNPLLTEFNSIFALAGSLSIYKEASSII